jgi:succinate dehydrogenase / fumarate reductase, membrane anchor subunit
MLQTKEIIMLDASSGPKSGEGVWLWLTKIITGALIIIILIIHFIVNHLAMPGGLLTWKDVVQYYSSNPIIPIMEIAFLIFVVSHSLIGLRSIILDLKPSRGVLKVVDWIFILGGCTAVVYGIWIVVAVIAQGQGV